MKEYIKMLLHINPELRPDAGQVMKVSYFSLFDDSKNKHLIL